MEHLQGDAGPTEESLGRLQVAPKVKAATAAGAVTVLIVWGLSYAGVTLPPEVSSAITALLAFAAGYLKTSN